MPSGRQLSQWRTIGLAAGGLVALVLGLLIAGHFPLAAGQYPSFSGCVMGIVIATAAKAYGEHAANAKAAATAKEPAASVLAQGATS